MIIHRYELIDEQWNKIESLFPTYSRGRPARHDNRKMLNTILWINRTGKPWCDLPERYGSLKTVYTRLIRWVRDGAKQGGPPEQKENQIGRRYGGNTTKIHTICLGIQLLLF